MSLRRDPFIIVSSGRAGSTLLSTMLNGNEKVFVPPESDFLARAYPFFYAHNGFSDQDLAIAVKLFKTTSQDQGWGMKDEYLKHELVERRPNNFAELNISIYEAYCKLKDLHVSYWGIKRPVLIASIDRILDVFPDSRIINILRDGRDVFLSYRRVHDSGHEWGPNGPVSCALYWVDGLRRVADAPRSHVEEVRYEDLVAQPEQEIKRLCGFLDIPYSDDMLDREKSVSGNKNVVMDKHKDTIHKNIKRKIDKGNVNKFLSEMKRTEVFLFELFAAPYLKKYGYQLVNGTLGSFAFLPLQNLAYWVARLFNDKRYYRRDKERYARALRG